MTQVAHKHDMKIDKDLIQGWFYHLQEKLCRSFELIEQQYATQIARDPGQFENTIWLRPGGGGGTMRVMRGRVFEKVGVNVSIVHGETPELMRSQLPFTEASDRFWAAGISVVAHMWSPHVPAMHFNTRCIETGNHWFGGGMDMTPAFPDSTETEVFHNTLKTMCDRFDPTYYPKFKAWCDDYFYLKHRQEPRGVGGIFFDYHQTPQWTFDFDFVQSVGTCFHDYYTQLVSSKAPLQWTDEQREKLLIKRGRYAEFNLLYDRGTQFGLQTNGNVEAILMSLPPEVRWP